jgi:glycosyltransferase involved in cell wall biosynthesis
VPLTVAVQGWLLPTGPSGANRRLRALLAELALRPGNVAVVLLEHVPIPAAPAWRRILAERRLLPGIVRASGADLLALATLPAPPPCGVPLCLTIHDLRDLGPHGRGRLRRAVIGRVLADAVARAAAVIVPSSFTRDEVLARCGSAAGKVHVVPNGVDERFFVPDRPAGADYLLHVGSLEPRKNIPLLLRAYALARQDADLPPLRLAGAWRSRDERHVRRVAAGLGLADHVRFAGAVADADLPGTYAGAAVTLVPSLSEGFGLPALEAQAAGCPVIVSDRGALPEVAGESGLVVAADDAAAWARAIVRLLRDARECLDRGRAGRERARAFTWARAADLERAVWEECVARAL